MAQKKKFQEEQPMTAEVVEIKKKSPKKKKVVEETKVPEVLSSENEVIDEGTLMMEVWQELDGVGNRREKGDKFIELFGKERYEEIFGERYEDEVKRIMKELAKRLDEVLEKDKLKFLEERAQKGGFSIEEYLVNLSEVESIYYYDDNIDELVKQVEQFINNEEKSASDDILDKFDKDLEAKGLGEDYFLKKEKRLKEMELEHEIHEFEIDKMLDEEN